MFRLSKPWGYYPPAVEEAVRKYEKTVSQLTDRLSEQVEANSRLKERIKALEEELRSMHIEMSSLELPDADEFVTKNVLEDFSRYNGSSAPDPEPIRPKNSSDSPIMVDFDDEDEDEGSVNQQDVETQEVPKKSKKINLFGKRDKKFEIEVAQDNEDDSDDSNSDGNDDNFFNIIT